TAVAQRGARLRASRRRSARRCGHHAQPLVLTCEAAALSDRLVVAERWVVRTERTGILAGTERIRPALTGVGAAAAAEWIGARLLTASARRAGRLVAAQHAGRAGSSLARLKLRRVEEC